MRRGDGGGDLGFTAILWLAGEAQVGGGGTFGREGGWVFWEGFLSLRL